MQKSLPLQYWKSKAVMVMLNLFLEFYWRCITEFWLFSPVVAVSRLVDVELVFISFGGPFCRLSSNRS